MAKQIIDLGTQGTQSGDTVRAAFDKSNDNFTELYDAKGKVQHYHGDNGSSYLSTSGTSWIYTSAFGDSLPAGDYLLICTFVINCLDLTFPEDLVGRFGVFDGNNTYLGGAYHQILQNGVITGMIINNVSLSSSTTIKMGLCKNRGSGTVRAAYFKWHAIKLET